MHSSHLPKVKIPHVAGQNVCRLVCGHHANNVCGIFSHPQSFLDTRSQIVLGRDKILSDVSIVPEGKGGGGGGEGRGGGTDLGLDIFEWPFF